MDKSNRSLTKTVWAMKQSLNKLRIWLQLIPSTSKNAYCINLQPDEPDNPYTAKLSDALSENKNLKG